MGASVTFDYQVWIKRYPEFGTVPEPTAQAYFNDATLYWRNDGSGPVFNEATQLQLLNMLTAHLAKLSAMASSGNPIVGRITDATEGSVSVSADKFANMSEAAQWFVQTTYGYLFWQATRQFRTARYRPARQFMPSGAPFGRFC